VVTPVSSNTAVEASGWFPRVERTRIGSPYVIEGMNQLLAEGLSPVVGYEANGGFLQADTITMDGRSLAPLPTRDALIVVLTILALARREGGVSALSAMLPARFTYSDRIKTSRPRSAANAWRPSAAATAHRTNRRSRPCLASTSARSPTSTPPTACASASPTAGSPTCAHPATPRS
jgi:phosphomannomutase